jgi:uncharacterized metal-binding protein
MRMPIRKAKMKDTEMHAANDVTIWVSTNRMLYTKLSDCHWGRCIQKTNVDKDVMLKAKRQINRKKLENFERNRVLSFKGKGTRFEKSLESGKILSHSRIERKLMISIPNNRK